VSITAAVIMAVTAITFIQNYNILMPTNTQIIEIYKRGSKKVPGIVV
jgi:hypothetical protein